MELLTGIMAKHTRGTIESLDKKNSETEAKKTKGEEYICLICLNNITEENNDTGGMILYRCIL